MVRVESEVRLVGAGEVAWVMTKADRRKRVGDVANVIGDVGQRAAHEPTHYYQQQQQRRCDTWPARA